MHCAKGFSDALPTFPTSQPRSPLETQLLRTGNEGRKKSLVLERRSWLMLHHAAATRTDGWREMDVVLNGFE